MSFEALAEPVTKLRTCQVEVELHPVAELPSVVGTSGLERQSARYGKLQRAIRSGSGPKEQVALQADTLAMQRQGEEQQRKKKRQAEGKGRHTSGVKRVTNQADGSPSSPDAHL